jgi:decaprenyl-phosphate phosphoribosyltransferase
MKNLLKLMRPKHYIKNLLLFFPIVFNGSLLNADLALKAVFGFVSFCLMSSVVYIINDIKDVEMDKMHSTKKDRPIASGAVSVKSAIVMAFFIFILSLLVNFAFNNTLLAWVVLFSYFIINILYSVLGFKHIKMLDIMILMVGFLLRIFFGSVITGIMISNWMYLTVIAISFYFSLGKRRNEILRESGTRKVLSKYNINFLNTNMNLCMTLAIVFYSLWCIDASTLYQHGNNYTIWSIPMVLLMVMRYSMIIENDSDGDTIRVVLSDALLIAMGLIYITFMYLVIYVF